MKKAALIIISLVLLLSLFSGCAVNSGISGFSEKGESFFAGFGKCEIKIPDYEPLYIAGYRNGYGITGVLDPLYSRAVALSVGGKTIVAVAVDCVGLASGTVNDIKREMKKNPLLSEVEITVSATHTHAGIDTMGLWGKVAEDGKSPDFMEAVKASAVAAAVAAASDMREGSLYFSKASVKELLYDSRMPKAYDENVYQIRFEPSDGGAGFRIINLGAHAEALRSENTLASPDYPAHTGKYIFEKTGDEYIYFAGALGGLIYTKMQKDANGVELAPTENVKKTGERIGAALLSVTEERKLSPTLSFATVSVTLPIENNTFVALRALGVLENEFVYNGAGKLGVSAKSRLSLLRIGEVTAALVPGELFPELAYGLPEFTEFYPVNGRVKNPKTFKEILNTDEFLVFGLTDDEIGYIVPPNDFLLHESSPYLEEARDGYGRNHYEETNSLSPHTAGLIAKALEELAASPFMSKRG